MSDPPHDPLLRALQALQGGEPAGDVRDEVLSFARMLVEARRRDHQEGGCPISARARAYALFDQLPESIGQTLARLVFDSWQQLAPAARSLGTERLLRYEAGGAALDLQVAPDAESRVTTLVLAVEGGGEALVAEVIVDEQAETVPLDDHGTGSLRFPHPGTPITVAVRDEDGELLLTPPVALE